MRSGRRPARGAYLPPHPGIVVNDRAIQNETKKLDAAGKRELAERLMTEAAEAEAKEPAVKR